MLASTALRSDLKQSIKILALKAQDANEIDIAELALAHHESRARNLDGIVARQLPAAKSLENLASFLAAATAEFGHGYRTREPVYDVTAVPPQQALIRARQPILRQVADHFK